MPSRTGSAQWNGNLREGNGTVTVESGTFEAAYGFLSRFENGTGTNPEELIGAAHAGCFSMALSAGLMKAGINAKTIKTNAVVHLEKKEAGFEITRIELETEAEVPGIDEATFLTHAQGAKENCPVSKALAGPEIKLSARLV